MDDSDEEDEEEDIRARKMRRGLAEPQITNITLSEFGSWRRFMSGPALKFECHS
jgi:hypothetical protein